MKKIFIFLFLLAIFCTPVKAYELQGGVSMSVGEARTAIMDGQVDYIGVPGHQTFDFDRSKVNIDYFYNANNAPIGYSVQYKDDLTKDYIYSLNDKLICVNKYDRPTNLYPHKGYKYDLKGNLVRTCITLTKGTYYSFSPEGHILARAVNNILYYKNTDIVLARTVSTN